ncbi:inositol monophosphatase family protein [Cohnella faecalis]|uniref:Inositol monophosphatase n=1 Tax=Cohnella faecalis TaxID=2315694 RepID=A0A398CFM8_9BACL|nr:inositol monophosphatase family protein [Cohnella faecalis]RIE01310.1 inositol monophosphatase [Cohnella faecalis]
MDRRVIQLAKKESIRIIRQAGQIAKNKFDNLVDIRSKGDSGDVVTEVDHMAEEIIINHIQSLFPDHQIHSEEAGLIGTPSDWQWLIDPLDGTNNFAIGLPIFTTSITLMYRKAPVLGVIYEPWTDRLFVSALNEGASCNDRPIHMKHSPNFLKGNIGWIQGHKVQNDPKAVILRQHIDVSFKRMLRLWAPTLQWCMLAKGDLDGIVLYNSEGDDLYSGVLMVKEAGGSVIDFEGIPFEGMSEEPYLIACHPDHKHDLLKIVKQGLHQ